MGPSAGPPVSSPAGRSQAAPPGLRGGHRLPAARGLDRAVLNSLAGGGYLRGHQNILIEGRTGVGKTFIACALANAACRQGFSARYYRLRGSFRN
jgi:DNA replication protein DnaC